MIIYNISLTEAILFSEIRYQKLIKLLEIRLKIGRETVFLKKMQFDS